jgi:predicted Ser/Thr protein kinase
VAHKLICVFCALKMPATETSCWHCRKPILREVGGRFGLENALSVSTRCAAYRGVDRTSGDAVFVRVLRPGASDEGRSELVNEARLQRRLEGESAFPRFIAAGRIYEFPGVYCVCEWIGGRPLQQALPGLRPIEKFDACLAAVGAVGKLHDLGVVHCMLYPNHVRVMEGGEIKILDLRRARESGTPGKGYGVRGYMAPEQYCGRCPVSPASDVFALGCMIYEALAEWPPFPPRFFEKVPRFVTPAPPSAVSRLCTADADDIIMKAIAVRPEDRYADAGQMGRLLAARLGETTITDGIARPEPWTSILAGAWSRLLATFVIIAAAGLIVGSGAGRILGARTHAERSSSQGARYYTLASDRAIPVSRIDATQSAQPPKRYIVPGLDEEDAVEPNRTRAQWVAGAPGTAVDEERQALASKSCPQEVPPRPGAEASGGFNAVPTGQASACASVKFLAYPPAQIRLGEFYSEAPSATSIILESGRHLVTVKTRSGRSFEVFITVEPGRSQVFKIYGDEQRIVRLMEP